MDLPRITYPITFSGRTFTVEELRVIQTLTRDCAGLPRTELAYTLCELLDWRRPTTGRAWRRARPRGRRRPSSSGPSAMWRRSCWRSSRPGGTRPAACGGS
jgi:hypothetical protein